MGNAEAERLSTNRNARTSKPQTSKDASHGILLFIDDGAQWNIPPPQQDDCFVLWPERCHFERLGRDKGQVHRHRRVRPTLCRHSANENLNHAPIENWSLFSAKRKECLILESLNRGACYSDKNSNARVFSFILQE